MPWGARSKRCWFKMKLITNLLEIARLSERNRKANFDFRAKLKWKVDDEALLDSQVHALYQEIANKIDCRTCGNCCKTYDIIVSDDDISRLSKAVGTTIDQFKNQYLKNAADSDGLCFKVKPCPFLKNNVCDQYEDRPEVCREYPHLNKNEFLGRTWSVIDNCSTCPHVFNVWERLKRKFNFR